MITYPLKSKETLARITEEEIMRINNFEKKWKIKTNKQKFQLTSISALKPKEVTIERENVPFVNKVKVLGLEIGTRGVSSHVRKRLNMAKVQYQKLKRFRKMSTKIQINLYKSLIRPIIEYPVIPMCISSKTNIKKIQQFQNRVLRTASRNTDEDNGNNIEELHDKYKLDAFNVRLHRLAQKCWDRMTTLNEELVEESREEDNDNPTTHDHYWWRRISPYANSEEPPPDYA